MVNQLLRIVVLGHSPQRSVKNLYLTDFYAALLLEYRAAFGGFYGLIEALGFPAILVPVVNFDNNQHEENENLRLGNLFRGVVTYAAVLRMD